MEQKWFMQEGPRRRAVPCTVICQYDFQKAVRILLEDGTEMVVRSSEVLDHKPDPPWIRRRNTRRRAVIDKALLLLTENPIPLVTLARWVEMGHAALYNVLKSENDPRISIGYLFRNGKQKTVVIYRKTKN